MCFVIKPKVKTMLTNYSHRRSLRVHTKDVIFVDSLVANEDGKTGVVSIPEQGEFDIIFDEFEMPKDAIPFANTLRKVSSAGHTIEKGINIIVQSGYFGKEDLVLIVNLVVAQVILVDKFLGLANDLPNGRYTLDELLNNLELDASRGRAFVRRLTHCSQRKFNYIKIGE